MNKPKPISKPKPLPARKIPTTVKRLKRGITPAGESETCGVTTVILSPILASSAFARFSPKTMPN